MFLLKIYNSQYWLAIAAALCQSEKMVKLGRKAKMLRKADIQGRRNRVGKEITPQLLSLLLVWLLSDGQSNLMMVVDSNPLKTLRGIIKSFRERASRAKRPGRGEFEIETRFDGEYPLANDQETLEAMNRLWNAYYQCLKETVAPVGRHRSITPKAYVVFQGHAIKLDCSVCLSPADLDAQEEEEQAEGNNKTKGARAKWLFSTSPFRKRDPVSLDERVLQNPLSGTLHIYGFREEDSGQYLCTRAKHVSAVYFLEMVSDDEPLSRVWPKSAPQGRQEAPPQEFFNKFQLSTHWSEWSPCAECGQATKRYRSGFCLVRLIEEISKNDVDEESLENENLYSNPKRNQTILDNSEEIEIKKITKDELSLNNYYNNSNSNQKREIILSRWIRSFEEDEEEEEKQEGDKNSKELKSELEEKDMESLERILHLFTFGLPCRSQMMPSDVSKWTPLVLRPNEIMVGFCKIRCPGIILFEVRNENGELLETANNSAGVYSSLQGIPPVSPPVQRITQFEDTSKLIIEVKCPGSLAVDIPVIWQIRGHQVIPVVLARESNRRIIIDPTGSIKLKHPRVFDSGLYSCWQREKLVGVVRLSVHKKITLSLNHHIMLIGIILIIGTFILVFYRTYKNRHALEL